MIYLLRHDLTPAGYILMERTDDGTELFFTRGQWLPSIPTTFLDEHVETSEYLNGAPINWWTKQYPDYVNATLIVRRKTREGYLKWLTEHPELLI